MCSFYRDASGIEGQAIEFDKFFSSLSIQRQIEHNLETGHPARRLQGRDHLHVNVQ